MPGPGDAPRPDGFAAGPAGPGPWQAWQAVPLVPQPGVIPLQPLGVGEIISGVFKTLRRYAMALYLPVLSVALGTVVLLLAGAGVAAVVLRGLFQDLQDNPDYQPTGDQAFAMVGVIVIGAVLLLVGMTAIYTVAYTTSAAVLRHAVLGRPATARQTWAESRPFLLRVLGAQLLAGLAGAGIVLVSFVPAVVVGVVAQSGAAFAGTLVCVVPGWLGAVYVQVRLVLVIPALVLENQSPIAAMRRAWKLNEGAWWRSLGIPYLVGMIGSFVTQIIAMPFVIVAMLFLSLSAGGPVDGSGTAPGPSLGAVMLMLMLLCAGVLLASTVTVPLAPLTHGLLYVDRRIRKESLDTVLAAEAGLPHWAAKPAPAPSHDTESGPTPE